MKPLHVGLLVVGAAIAGGLAVKMTEPPRLPVMAPRTAQNPIQRASLSRIPGTPAAAGITVHASATVPVPTSAQAVLNAETAAPPPVYSQPVALAPRRTPFPSASGKQPNPEQVASVMPVEPASPYQRPAPAQPGPLPIAPEPESTPTAVPNVAPEVPPAPASPRRVTLEPGMTVSVRMLETLSSDRAAAGDTFSASLAQPLVVDGLVIAERGARVDGRVVDARHPARINGRSEIQLALSSVTTSDGQQVAISTEPWVMRGFASHTTQAEEIGGGAALGAIIGAIAGGGAGAALGAGIGGGAGIGAAAATKSQPATVSTESVIRFRLNSRIIITERQL